MFFLFGVAHHLEIKFWYLIVMGLMLVMLIVIKTLSEKK